MVLDGCNNKIKYKLANKQAKTTEILFPYLSANFPAGTVSKILTPNCNDLAKLIVDKSIPLSSKYKINTAPTKVLDKLNKLDPMINMNYSRKLDGRTTPILIIAYAITHVPLC